MPKFLDALSAGWAKARTVISDTLAHRSTTWASLAVGLTSIAGSMQTMGDTFGQIAAVKHLPPAVVTHAASFSLELGAIGAVCLILAGIGKSVALKPAPPINDPGPTNPGATTFHVIPGPEAASVTTQLTIVPKSDEEKKAA